MLCVGMDNWETKLKGKAPYEGLVGLVLCAFYIRVLAKDTSKVFFVLLGAPKVIEHLEILA